MAERDPGNGADLGLDGLLGDAVADTRRWSAQSPVPIEALERRAARRRTGRLASAGALTLAVVVTAAVATIGGSSNRDTDIAAISVAAEPPPAVRTATPDDVHVAPSGTAVRVEGLPTEGVAVEDGDSVLLLSIDGAVLQRLDGFRLRGYPQRGELLLDGPDGTVYELDALAGVLAPRPPGTGTRTALSYGAVLVRPAASSGSGVVQRDGQTLFSAGRDDAVRASWDRDIVTRIAGESKALSFVAFDLRTTSARRLPDGCVVADRHGPAWFLVCSTPDNDVSIVRLDANGSTEVLLEASGGKSYVDAMVSPDGRQLLVYFCISGSMYMGSTSGGDLQKVDVGVSTEPQPLGWSAHGELVFVPHGFCGSDMDRRGVFALDGQQVRTISEAPGKAAMWMPVLEHR